MLVTLVIADKKIGSLNLFLQNKYALKALSLMLKIKAVKHFS